MVESDPACSGQNLSSFLITPVQRLPRYCLLLEELSKTCEKEGIECESVRAALQQIRAASTEVNESKRDAEEVEFLRRLCRTFVGKQPVRDDGSGGSDRLTRVGAAVRVPPLRGATVGCSERRWGQVAANHPCLQRCMGGGDACAAG